MQALSSIKTSNFLHASKRLHELTRIRSTAITLLKYKKDRLKLEKKYEDTKNKFATKQKILDKERRQETKKIRPKKSKLLKKSEKVASSGIIDLLITFAKIKALMWIGDPENLAKVQAIVKGLTGVFKFIDWFATGSVTNLLDGLHSLLFGGSILERIFGLFSAIVGFFGIRYLLNPFKLIKDLKFVIKNGDKIGQIFSAFKESGIKKGAADLAQKLTKTADIFKRGLSRGLGRAILKVFGKTGFKFLAKAVAPAVGGLTKLVGGPLKAIATKTIGGIPVVGPLLNLGINLLLGDPLDKALFKTVGSTLGMGLGALVGSVFPGPGTIVGGALGGILGDWASSTLYDWMKGAISKKEEPALAVGGIVTKPTRALIGEAGPEAVIPLPKIYDGTILNAPMGIVASSMIGGIDAVISSLGPIGLTIRPYASSLLAPYRREFGASNYVFTSDIGRTSTDVTAKATTQTNDQEEVAKILGLNKTVNLIKKKEASEEAKKSRYNSGNSIREILGDILNNIINLDFTGTSKKTKPTGDEDPAKSQFTGPIPQGKSADFWTLAAIASREDGDPQGQADVAQSIYNRLASGAYGGRTIKDLIISTGQYEPTWKYPKGPTRGSGTPNAEWLNITDIKSAAAATGTSEGHVAAAARAILDAGLQKKSAEFVQGRTDFTGYPKTSRKSQIQRKSGDNYFGWDFNYRNNLVASVPTFTGVKMQTGGLVSRGDITSKFGNKESFRKNAHEGIDIAFPSGTPLSFSLGGKFIKIARTSSTEKEANGGYGQYMDVKLTDGKIARLAHLSSIPNWVKQGSEFAPNAVIALSGGIPKAPGSGRSGGAHLHLEQHTTQKDLAETLNGKVDPLSQGLFGLLRKGGAPGSATNGPAQPSQAPATSPDTVPESEETDSGSAFNPELIAKNLGELFQMITGTSKTNSAQLQKDSMDYLQAFKDFKPNPDTYIMAGGTNIFSSTTMLTPISQPDYSVGSFSSIDSATAFNLKTRL
jgi:murein DD-endopeptidase MepM/ murein hydrolase activator NlpD